MGNCLVVYGRRPADLALAALVQGDLGLPVYLHEADAAQTGFLVEAWPCGLVIEVGPVPQSVLDPRIVRQTLLALEACLQGLSSAARAQARYPKQLVVHRHLGSVDSLRIVTINPGPCCTRTCWARTGLRCVRSGRCFAFSAVKKPTLPCAPWMDRFPCSSMRRLTEKEDCPLLTRREVWSASLEWIAALEALMRQSQAQVPFPSWVHGRSLVAHRPSTCEDDRPLCPCAGSRSAADPTCSAVRW